METTGSSFEVPQGIEKQLEGSKISYYKGSKIWFSDFVDILIYE